MSEHKPIHEVRFGRVKCAIWKNEGAHGVRHSVTFQKIYKADDGWKSTDSFGRDDLPLVAKVADLAHSWIYEQGQQADG